MDVFSTCDFKFLVEENLLPPTSLIDTGNKINFECVWQNSYNHIIFRVHKYR